MKKFLILLLLIILKLGSFAQGRVLINEYMPWAPGGCNLTSEFVELYNFGPGPVDIGCYILTEGDYSITIPPNTILQPGQYYLISGQDIIAKDCANLDSAVHVNLNWNNCNCTSGPIPQDKDGLFSDGGGGKEQVVLLDANLNVIDAVARDPKEIESSSSIKTSALGGNCSSKTFNLDLMNIVYEKTVGQSTGRANSYARIIDGDCNWIKETSQSANAPNFSQGDVASVSYELTMINSMICGNTKGAISINVIASNYNDIFPMDYILAYDADSNHVFTSTDQYTYGTDDSPSRIDVGDLKAGRYRITLSSILGCNLKTFDFQILECSPTLPVQVLSFKHLKTEQSKLSFSWTISEIESVHAITLEQSSNNSLFTTAYRQNVDAHANGTQTFTTVIPASEAKSFRLRITLKTGATIFSATISTHSSVSTPISKLWPNPARSFITVETGAQLSSSVSYKIYNVQNSLVEQGEMRIGNYQYNFTLPVHRLPKGLYQLYVFSEGSSKPISFRFVKD